MKLLTLLISVCTAEVTWAWQKVYHHNNARTTSRPIFHSNWTDFDNRKLPHWYDEAKIGILVHWGIYTVPAYSRPTAPDPKYFSKYLTKGNREVKKFMDTNYGEKMTYEELAHIFSAEQFDPDEWANLFKKAGAKYVIITAKDGDGFALFPSQFSPKWNSKDIGPRQDLVGLLKRALKRHDLVFGVYYYLVDWFTPNKTNNNFINNFIRYDSETKSEKENEIINSYIKTRLELEQLVKDYEPKVIWADGEKFTRSPMWRPTEFIAWLYNESPVGDDVVVNDRWERASRHRHGDFFTDPECLRTKQCYPKEVRTHKWEKLITLDPLSLGYRKVKPGYLSVMHTQELIQNIVITVCYGGNVLINVGATAEGLIPPEFQKPLRNLGTWLGVNGEAIYGTSPRYKKKSNNGTVWYTCKSDKYDGHRPIDPPFRPDIHTIYIIFFEWPDDNILKLEDIGELYHNKDYKIKLLGSSEKVSAFFLDSSIHIYLPKQKGRYAWTLKFTTKPDPVIEDEEIEDYHNNVI